LANGIVAVCQFKAPYQLSEITDIIRGKMVLAIAKMLEVNASIVVLGFSSVVVRRRDLLQQGGVLVSVGLINFQDSVSIFATRITQENINAKMAAEGLLAVQLLVAPSTGTVSSQSSSVNLNSSSISDSTSTSTSPSIVIGAAVGGALCLMAAAGIAWFIKRRKAKSMQVVVGPSELVIVHDSRDLQGRLRNVGLRREELEVGEYRPLERYEEGPAPSITFSQSVLKCNQRG
jgi:hypothetical protein